MIDFWRVMRWGEEHSECSEQIIQGFRRQVGSGVLGMVWTRWFLPQRSSGAGKLPPLNCLSPSYQNPIGKSLAPSTQYCALINLLFTRNNPRKRQVKWFLPTPRCANANWPTAFPVVSRNAIISNFDKHTVSTGYPNLKNQTPASYFSTVFFTLNCSSILVLDRCSRRIGGERGSCCCFLASRK